MKEHSHENMLHGNMMLRSPSKKFVHKLSWKNIRCSLRSRSLQIRLSCTEKKVRAIFSWHCSKMHENSLHKKKRIKYVAWKYDASLNNAKKILLWLCFLRNLVRSFTVMQWTDWYIVASCISVKCLGVNMEEETTRNVMRTSCNVVVAFVQLS